MFGRSLLAWFLTCRGFQGATFFAIYQWEKAMQAAAAAADSNDVLRYQVCRPLSVRAVVYESYSLILKRVHFRTSACSMILLFSGCCFLFISTSVYIFSFLMVSLLHPPSPFCRPRAFPSCQTDIVSAPSFPPPQHDPVSGQPTPGGDII
jgi:hypothetical protein